MKKPILSWSSQDSCKILNKCLQEEKIFIGSTDTILGLFALPTQKGFNLLRKLKNRENKPFLLLISSTICVEKYISEKALFQIENLTKVFWPGPLTIVCNALFQTPSYLKSEEGTIAFRMPKHEGIQRLLKMCPMIFSTSANKAGEPFPSKIEELNQALLDEVEYLVLDEQEDESKVPSTIIRCDEEGRLSLIREGAIPFGTIQKSTTNEF